MVSGFAEMSGPTLSGKAPASLARSDIWPAHGGRYTVLRDSLAKGIVAQAAKRVFTTLMPYRSVQQDPSVSPNTLLTP